MEQTTFHVTLAKIVPATYHGIWRRAVDINRHITSGPTWSFLGYEGDLNEKTWEGAGLDWRLMDNRAATSIGYNIWVVTGYSRETGDAYVFIVQKHLPMRETNEL